MCDNLYNSFKNEGKNLMYPQIIRTSLSSFHRDENKTPLHFSHKNQNQCNPKNIPMIKYSGGSGQNTTNSYQQSSTMMSNINRNRYVPYTNRIFPFQNGQQTLLSSNNQLAIASSGSACTRNFLVSGNDFDLIPRVSSMANQFNLNANTIVKPEQMAPISILNNQSASIINVQQRNFVTLQISNLDNALDEASLKSFLLAQLKPITPIVNLIFEGSTYAKVTVPDLNFAKQVVANLHRKKIGHKRMIVSYTRDSSLTEIKTLRCQVAGLLKDVPFCTLPMYKFRELFQSRFKTSISVLDLYKMQDICNITADQNDDKYISLHSYLINSIECNPLVEGLQHSVPYCTKHFIRETHKGWAEQDIEPLPNVRMTISEIQKIIYPLLKSHHGDIPVASLLHCIQGQLNITLTKHENGVNLEHLICCVNGIHITTNNFGIKILSWLEPDSSLLKENESRFNKNSVVPDPLYQISREVVELIKMCPKSTMKFNRFIPAYHNHFGKQCRVADYGYTKLIELFDALNSVVQIMGDGENRQITLTHRTQIRRFTSDLLRILRSHGNKTVILSQLPKIFSQNQNKIFEVTDYGVCEITDILDGLVNSNIVVLSAQTNSKDIIISIPKRKQSYSEIEKTSVFAEEVIELLRNSPQYSILFQKFVRSYHYHFGYQCRLSDYGFLKLADLMEAIHGVVEIKFTSDEDKKIYLSSTIAQRVFSEQLEQLIKVSYGSSNICIKLEEVLNLHKKKYGYQIQQNTLGESDMIDVIKKLPYIEMMDIDETIWIICHLSDNEFRKQSYRSCKIIKKYNILHDNPIDFNTFIEAYEYHYNEGLAKTRVLAMKHLITFEQTQSCLYLKLSNFANFLLNIANILKNGSKQVCEIKKIINISNSVYFEFGYPNLYNILMAYADIFILKKDLCFDRCEVKLALNNEFAQIETSINGELNQNMGIKSNTKKRQALSEYNIPNKIALKCENSLTFSNPSVDEDIKCHNQYISSKNNIIGIVKTSLDANSKELTSESDTYIKEEKINRFDIEYTPNIWNRPSNKYQEDVLNNLCYNKTENKFQSSSQNLPMPETLPHVPFWVDPVWSNKYRNKKQQLNSLNINLPEIKTKYSNESLNAMSPYTLSKTENMKRTFIFESPSYKKIS